QALELAAARLDRAVEPGEERAPLRTRPVERLELRGPLAAERLELRGETHRFGLEPLELGELGGDGANALRPRPIEIVVVHAHPAEVGGAFLAQQQLQ